MKAGFALNLAPERLSLLCRTAEGWIELGHAAFDDPAIDETLAGLRQMAEARAPGGFATKLILPETQLLYTDVDAPGPDRASRRAQIAAALESRTPYAVKDLVFDWSRIGETVRAVVAARVTLDEAEAFADAHGFRPVSFVAMPAPGQFAGEPWFGEARGAARYLPAGGRVDRDQDPVVIVVAPVPVEIEPVENEPSVPNAPEIPGQKLQNTNISDNERPAESPAAAPAVPAARPAPSITSDVIADETEAPFIAIDDRLAGDEEPPPPRGDVPPQAAAFASRRPAERAGGAGAEDDAEDGGAGPATRLHFTADPEADYDAARRARGPDAAISVTGGELEVPAALVGTPDPEPERAEPTAVKAPLGRVPDARHGTQAQQRARREPVPPHRDGPAQGAAPVAAPVTASPTVPAAQVRSSDSAAEMTAGVIVADAVAADAGVGDTLRAEAPRPVPADPAPARLAARPAQERSGGLGLSGPGRPGAQGRVRTGLVLTGLLVAVMALVAFWFSGSGPETGGEAVAAQSVDGAGTQGSAQEGGTSAAASETVAGAAATETASGAAEAAEAGETAAPATAAAAAAPEAAPDAAAEGTGDVATGPQPDASGAPVIAKTQPVVPPPRPEGVAGLPDANQVSTDAALPAQPVPPPFGTEIEFGPDGLIKATPEGVITPGGFMLFSGKPPVVPKARATTTPPETVNPISAPSGPEDTAPVLAAADPAPAEAAPLPVDPALAGKTPRVRPEAVQRRAEAVLAEAAALAEAEAAAAKAQEEALASATKEAVASSRRPSERPSTLATAVSVAVAAAVVDAAAAEAATRASAIAPVATPSPQPAPPPPAVVQPPAQQVAAAAPAPEPPKKVVVARQAPAPTQEVDEPEPTHAVPNIPTTRTVAKQATIANALRLGDLNLIGVYGSSANRRALVRTSNGRFIKVKVGDRLDGGQVAAIGDGELAYVKSGRTILLRMVKGG